MAILRAQFLGHVDGREYFLYADAGYDYCNVLGTAAVYNDMAVGLHEQANSVRVSVENAFGALKGKVIWKSAKEVASKTGLSC